MLRTLLASAALLAGVAPAHAGECWGVFHLEGANPMFVDLEHGDYIEYRILRPEAPPEDRNPAHYRVMFSLLLDHDIATDAVLGSTIVAEAREPDSERMVAMPAGESSIEAWSGGARVSDEGDEVTLIENSRADYRHASNDPGAGRALYGEATRGGTIHLRYRVDGAGEKLDAARDGVFAADPAYQNALRVKARALAEQQRQSGQCPLEHHD